MNLSIVCCLHGTEPYGLEVVKMLPASVPYFIGNTLALEKKKRFIDTDLNRCFPGKNPGNHEEKLANFFTLRLKDFDYVIDLHSSSNACPLFGIITKPNKEKIDFAKKLGLKRIVIMPESFASGKSLIDYVKCGISLEVGPHSRKESVSEVAELINNFLDNKNTNDNLEILEVFAVIKRKANEIKIDNFEEIEKGQIIANGTKEQKAEFDFIPILVNEEAYKGVLCLASRRVNL